VISRVWEATAAKQMQIDPYCQWRKCSLVNVVSSNIRVMQIFARVREIWGLKQGMVVKSAIFVISRVWEATTAEPPIQFVSSYYISMISLHNAVVRLP